MYVKDGFRKNNTMKSLINNIYIVPKTIVKLPVPSIEWTIFIILFLWAHLKVNLKLILLKISK